MHSSRGQTTVEMMVVMGLLLVIFTLVLLMVYTKTVESNDFKLQLDAKRVAQSVADNINNIAQQGDGYYRFYELPLYLLVDEDYNLSVYGNFVEINWTNRYGEQRYSVQLVTANVSAYCFTKGGGQLNKVFNYKERILLTCNRSDLMLVEDSFNPSSFLGKRPFNISIEVFNYGVLPTNQPVDVSFTLINLTGHIALSGSDDGGGSVLDADSRSLRRIIVPPSIKPGIYNVSIRADPANLIEESTEEDNWYNATIEIT